MTNRKFMHRGWAKALRSGEAGSALVETALAVPLLLLLLVGAAELGMGIYGSIEVSNAARAAVQYAAMNGGANATISATAQPTLDTQGMLKAATNDAPNPSWLSAVAFVAGSPTASCACSNGVGTSTCEPGDCTGAQIEETVTVQTTATYTPPFSLPGLPSTFTLNGYAQEMVLQ